MSQEILSPPAPTLRGVEVVGATASRAPIVTVIAREKTGKSYTSITSMAGWPYNEEGEPTGHPLIIAADPEGPQACTKAGYQAHTLAPRDAHKFTSIAANETSVVARTSAVIDYVCSHWQPYHPTKWPYTSLIYDCISTTVMQYLAEDMEKDPQRDPRRNYGNILAASNSIYLRLKRQVNERHCVPLIFLGWAKEPSTTTTGSGANKEEKKELGGLDVPGRFRQNLAGWSTQILLLTIKKIGVGKPHTDSDGMIREFHTRAVPDMAVNGRFSHLMPKVIAPADLGFVLWCLTQKGWREEWRETYSSFFNE